MRDILNILSNNIYSEICKIESLEDIQRRGNKTLTAMYNLINEGVNGKENRSNLINISIKKITELVKENNEFYSQIFKIESSSEISEYKITNLENGRSYVGQTRQAFKERWRTHLKRGVKAEPGTQNKLYAAMWEDGTTSWLQ